MIFLIEYDRALGKIVTLEEFDDSERDDAWSKRLEMELDLSRRGVDREVVLLEAETEEALRLTHRRYFEDLSELVESR
jgi:hypothetical protein